MVGYRSIYSLYLKNKKKMKERRKLIKNWLPKRDAIGHVPLPQELNENEPNDLNNQPILEFFFFFGNSSVGCMQRFSNLCFYILPNYFAINIRLIQFNEPGRLLYSTTCKTYVLTTIKLYSNMMAIEKKKKSYTNYR